MNKILVALVAVILVAVVFVGLDTMNSRTSDARPVAKTDTPATPVAAAENPATTAAEPADEEARQAEIAAVTAKADFAVPVIYGNADAPVVIEEYASYTCSHCADFYKNTLPKVKEKYLDTGKAVLKMHSFVRNEPDLAASMLVQCMPSNEEKQRFTKALFNAQDSWAFTQDPIAALATLARVGGVNDAKFKECLADKNAEASLLKTRQHAADDRKINSTPYFFVNDEAIKGARGIEAFDAAVADAEKKK